MEKNTFREVYHIWYLWPVNGVQSDGAGLIAVLLEARALQRGGPGPIVVHCSPGTGRTGTLIALDLGIRQYEITRTVDVPRVVYTIRRDRAGAVKTKEQYAFIYKVICFLNSFACTLLSSLLTPTKYVVSCIRSRVRDHKDTRVFIKKLVTIARERYLRTIRLFNEIYLKTNYLSRLFCIVQR